MLTPTMKARLGGGMGSWASKRKDVKVYILKTPNQMSKEGHLFIVPGSKS